jgi:hypothetical protein
MAPWAILWVQGHRNDSWPPRTGRLDNCVFAFCFSTCRAGKVEKHAGLRLGTGCLVLACPGHSVSFPGPRNYASRCRGCTSHHLTSSFSPCETRFYRDPLAVHVIPHPPRELLRTAALITVLYSTLRPARRRTSLANRGLVRRLSTGREVVARRPCDIVDGDTTC